MTICEAAARVAAESPPPGDWPAVGYMFGPAAKRWVPHCRRAGWPVRAVTVMRPASTQAGRGSGRMVPQPATVVPGPWLRRLAEIMGVPWAAACGGKTTAQE